MYTKHLHSNEKCTLYSEQYVIDYILDTLSKERRLSLEKHLASCYTCQQTINEWNLILTSRTVEHPPFMSDPAISINQEKKTYQRATPMYKLHCAVFLNKMKHLWKIYILNKSYLLAASAAIVLLLLTFTHLASNMRETNHQTTEQFIYNEYMNKYEPNAINFVQAENSVRYKVESGVGDGFIWLNNDSAEILLWLDHLPAIELSDYQVWAISEHSARSLGIISTVGQQGHLYLESTPIHSAEFIAISVEPKGGNITPSPTKTVLVVKQP